jgi:hypothetical protein
MRSPLESGRLSLESFTNISGEEKKKKTHNRAACAAFSALTVPRRLLLACTEID